MERADSTIAEMVEVLSLYPPTSSRLRLAAVCIERVFSAMLRLAHEGVEIASWHVGKVAIRDLQSPTLMLVDFHGCVQGTKFISKFNRSLRSLVTTLPGPHTWVEGDAINEQPVRIQRHVSVWRAFFVACGQSLMEFRGGFDVLPDQDRVETGLRSVLMGHVESFQEAPRMGGPASSAGGFSNRLCGPRGCPNGLYASENKRART